jgi:predicted outer membrane repeat protein
VTLTSDTVQYNTAATAGGGLYVGAGTVTLTSDTVQYNTAATAGGGLYIASGAVVYLDAFTLGNVINNTAPKHQHPNIDGSFQKL